MQSAEKSEFELNTCFDYLHKGFYCFLEGKPSKYLTRHGLLDKCTYGWFNDFQEFVECFNKYSGETLMEIRNGELWTIKNIARCKECGQEIKDGNQSKCAA